MNIFNILILVILFLCFGLACFLIFLKIKNRKIALFSYTGAAIFTILFAYSLLNVINSSIFKTNLSNVKFTRILNQESLVISGKIENLSNFVIKSCFMNLTISQKGRVGAEIFDAKNIKKANFKNNSISYVIEIANKMPANTFSNFSISIPFPVNFSAPEYYYTYECYKN